MLQSEESGIARFLILVHSALRPQGKTPRRLHLWADDWVTLQEVSVLLALFFRFVSVPDAHGR
jgi:hypothetical protein